MQTLYYEISEDDVDEVLDAHEPTGGGRFPESVRLEMRALVLQNVTEIDESVAGILELGGIDPTDEQCREAALSAIEDLLIREDMLELDRHEDEREFPMITEYEMDWR